PAGNRWDPLAEVGEVWGTPGWHPQGRRASQGVWGYAPDPIPKIGAMMPKMRLDGDFDAAPGVPGASQVCQIGEFVNDFNAMAQSRRLRVARPGAPVAVIGHHVRCWGAQDQRAKGG